MVDHGLAQAVRFMLSEDYGKILKNIVYMELFRRDAEVFYFQDNVQCDFILQDKNRIAGALQVIRSLQESRTVKREVKGLVCAMKDLELKKGLILTEDEDDSLEVDGFAIRVLPVWYWLLGSGTGSMMEVEFRVAEWLNLK